MNFSVKRDYSSVVIYNIFMVFLFATFLYLCIASSWFFLVFLLADIAALGFYNTSVLIASCQLTDQKLLFRTGAFKYDIDLNDIVQVNESVNIYPSLALSCERVRIVTYKDGKQKVYYISVVDNKSLVDILQKQVEKNDAKLGSSQVENQVTEQQPDTEMKNETKIVETPKTTAKKATAKKTTTKKTSTTSTKKTTAKKTTTAKKPATKKATKTTTTKKADA